MSFNFVQMCPIPTAKVLASVLIKSLLSGEVPASYKEANIKPLKKQGKNDYTVATNFRPISVTSVLSRLTERVICQHLTCHLDKFQILRENQFGSRKKLGTRHALSYTFLNLKHIRDKWRGANIVFLDLRKAFDRVAPSFVVLKLKKLGFPEPLILWIYEFLTNRRQRVKIGGDLSDWTTVLNGLPQGTVLGPVLFSIFINDLPISLDDSGQPEGCIYVDDVSLWANCAMSDQISHLNKQLVLIEKWAVKWGMDFSSEKSKWLRVGKKVNAAYGTPSLKGKSIEAVSTFQYLGVIFDEKLSFDQHILLHILPRVRKSAGYLQQLTKGSTVGGTDFAKAFWLGKLLPIIEYSSEVWMHHISAKTLALIEQFQSQTIKKLLKLPNSTSSDKLLAELGIPHIKYRLQGNALKWYYTLKLPETPQILQRAIHINLNFQGSHKNIQKSFYHPNKTGAITARNLWVNKHKNDVSIPNKWADRADLYFQSLLTGNTENKYTYPLVYPVNGKHPKWKAIVYLKNRSDFPPCQIKHLKQFQYEIDYVNFCCTSHNEIKIPDLDKSIIRRATRQWVRNVSEQHFESKRCLPQIEFHHRYQVDKVVCSLTSISGREIRKMRLKCSRCRFHSWYNYPDKSKVCDFCDLNKVQNNKHLLLECPKFDTARRTMLNELKKFECFLPATEITAQTLLSFDTVICDSQQERHELRLKLFQIVICFLDIVYKINTK